MYLIENYKPEATITNVLKNEGGRGLTNRGYGGVNKIGVKLFFQCNNNWHKLITTNMIISLL